MRQCETPPVYAAISNFGIEKSCLMIHFSLDKIHRLTYHRIVMATTRNDTTVHLTMLKSLKKKLDQLASADRRDKTEFLRLLIEDEWNRRFGSSPTVAQEGNGAQS
jgi:hypothetical protein